jgi:hypothetical protein
MNAKASALRFFFTVTLGRADLAHHAREHGPAQGRECLAPSTSCRGRW